MPPRVWRTDEVTPLAPHQHDPALPTEAGAAEFLTTFAIAIPDDTPAETVGEVEALEAGRAKELAGQGLLQRLWRLLGRSRAWLVAWPRGAADAGTIESLPMDRWMTAQTTPLTSHPSDPAQVTR